MALAGAGDLAIGNRAMSEQAFRQRSVIVGAAAGVEHVGHQLDIVGRRQFDAMAGHDHAIELHIVPDLENSPVFQQRLDEPQCGVRGQLVRRHIAGEQAGAVAAFTVDQRHVAGFIRADGKRQATQFRLHRVGGAGRLGGKGHASGVTRAGDPVLQLPGSAHRIVARAVEFRRPCALDPRRRERLGSEHSGSLARWTRCLLVRCGAPRRSGRCGGKLALPGTPVRAWGRSRRCRPANGQPIVRRDLGGIDAGKFCDPARQRVELHRLEKRDQPLRIRIMNREIGKRHVERHVAVEGDQGFRQPRQLGVLDERLPPLLLLDLAGTRQQGVEIAIFADQLRRSLDPDSRNARHIVGGIADQRLHLDHLVGWHAEFFYDLSRTDPAVLHGVVHHDLVVDELHEVLVGRHDGRARTGLASLPHVRGNQIVGLVADLFEAGQIERVHRLADQAELRDQVGGRLRPVRLVIGIKRIAKGLFRLVKHDREVARPFLRLHVAQQLPQHAAEAVDGIELQPIRLARQRRQGMIGAENIGRSVNEKDVVADVEIGRGFRHGANVEGSRTNGNLGKPVHDRSGVGPAASIAAPTQMQPAPTLGHFQMPVERTLSFWRRHRQTQLFGGLV